MKDKIINSAKVIGSILALLWFIGFIHEIGRESGIRAVEQGDQSWSELAVPSESEEPREPRDLFAEIGQETRVQVSRQSAEGVTNDQISVEVAERMGEWSVERTKFHTQRYLDEVNSADDASQIKGETVLIPQGGTNFVVTRLWLGEVNYGLIVMAVQGSELVRIACLSPDAAKTVFLHGKCDEALKDTLGFDVLPH